MPSTRFDTVCEQGADLSFQVTYTDNSGNPVNLTGGSARMQARTSINSSVAFLDLDTGSKGGLTLGGSNGVITVFVAGAVTAGYPGPVRAVYDLQFTDINGRVSRVIEGRLNVKKSVTR